jgi:hypothetical protein
MSYAWFPVDVNLYQNHKTARLARLLKCPRVHAVGHMVCLWAWACVHAPDGYLGRLQPEDIATAAEWEGDPEAFQPALVEAGLLDEDGTLHEWEDHQGNTFRKRLYEAEKKRKQRDTIGTDGGPARDNMGTGWGCEDTKGQDRRRQEKKRIEEEDLLVRLALEEIAPSESTAEDYRRIITKHRGRLSNSQIERIIYELAGWTPKKPRAKLHLTLGSWLTKEEPEKPSGGPAYPTIEVPDGW